MAYASGRAGMRRRSNQAILRGRRKRMNVTFQVSLYPVGREEFKPPIDAFIADLRADGLCVDVCETATIGRGALAAVFAALERAYERAAKGGEAVMVVTVASGAPTKDELARLNPR